MAWGSSWSLSARGGSDTSRGSSVVASRPFSVAFNEAWRVPSFVSANRSIEEGLACGAFFWGVAFVSEDDRSWFVGAVGSASL